MDPSKVDLITKWQTPKSAKQVKSFLCVANYYRRFVQSFAQRSASLRELTAKDKPCVWEEEEQKSFADLKQELTNPPILQFPDNNREYFLETASIHGISYILSQRDDEGRKYVISYGGRGLRPCERKWGVSEIECLALLTGIREYHVYLVGRFQYIQTI